MKKLLVVGASILQLPAIKRAKEMGFYVGVLDYDPNAIGISFADEYFNVSTIDVDGVVQCATDFQPSGIMTLATDMPMRSIAAACEKLGLPGISYETAIKATDKGEMIKAFEEYGVSHPWYFIISNKDELNHVIDKIKFPCVSKPVDNSGSRGVVLVKNKEELCDAITYSSKNGRSGGIIIEEYMQGPEVSVETISLDGETYILQVTDKITTGAPHFVEMGHSQPSNLNKDDVERICNLAKKAVEAIGIENGPAHVEIIITDDGPKMVEIGARMGGDCITTHLLPLSTGIDMVEATIRIACGEKPDIKPKFHKGSAIKFLDAPCGTIVAVNGIDQAEKIDGVKEVTITKHIGDKIGEIDSSIERPGFLIAQSENSDKAVAICEEAAKLVTFCCEDK